MATIDRFVIEATIDPSRMTPGLNAALKQLDKFMTMAETRMRARALNPLAGVANLANQNGVKAAQELVSGLNKQFAKAELKRTSLLGSGAIDLAEFERQGVAAKLRFNQGLTRARADLSALGISSTLEASLISQYKKVGNRAAAGFAGALHLGQAAGGRGGAAAEQIIRDLEKTFQNQKGSAAFDLAQGKINPQQFHALGIQAANQFDKALAGEITSLLNRGLIDSNVEAALIGKFKSAGAKSSRAFYDEFARNNARLKNLGEGLATVGSAMTKAVTLPVLAMGTAVAVSASQFQKGMNEVRANTGATYEEFTKLNDAARALGQSEFGATTISKGMAELARAGFSATEIIKGMPAAMNLATAGELDLSQAAKVVTNVLRSQNFAIDQSGRVADVLTRAAISAQTDVNDLAVAFKYVGAIGASAGLTFENTTAALEALSQAGFTASFSGTALRGSIAKLLSPTAKGGHILEDMGIHILDTSGKMLNFSTIVEQMEKRGVSVTKVLDIFGQRAGPGMAALLAVGSKKLREFEVDLLNAENTAQQVRFIQLQGAAGEVLRLKAAFQELSIAIGASGFLSILTSVIKFVNFLATTLSNINPHLLAFVTSVVLMSAAVGPLLFVIGKAIRAFALYNAAMRAAAVATGVAEAATISLGAVLAIGGGVIAGILAAAGALTYFANRARIAAADGEAFKASLVGMSTAALTKTLADTTAEFRELQHAQEELAPKIKVTVNPEIGSTGVSRSGVSRTKTIDNPEYTKLAARMDVLKKRIQDINDARQKSLDMDGEQAKNMTNLAELQAKLQAQLEGSSAYKYGGGHEDTAAEAFQKKVQQNLSLLESQKTLQMDTSAVLQTINSLQTEGLASIKSQNLELKDRVDYMEALAAIYNSLNSEEKKYPFEKQATDLAKTLKARVDMAQGPALESIIEQSQALMDQIKGAIVVDVLNPMGANIHKQASLARALDTAHNVLDEAIRKLEEDRASVPEVPTIVTPHNAYINKRDEDYGNAIIDLTNRTYALRDAFTSQQQITDQFSIAFSDKVLGILEQIPTPAEAMMGALSQTTSTLTYFRSGISAVLGAIDSAVNPISFFGNIFSAIASAMQPELSAFEVLTPVIQDFADIIRNTLQPIMETLAPVLRTMFVPLQAILNVLVPIIKALIPLLNIVSITLEILFPIIKMVAIVFTYVAQVAFTLVGAFLKVVQWLQTGIGWLIRAIGKAVNFLLPGNPANGLVRFGQGMMDAGAKAGEMADAFFSSAHDMAKARAEIEGVNLADTFAKTADAANKAAENLQNVPDGYKVLLALRRFEATQAVNAGGTPTRGYVPASTAAGSVVTPPSTAREAPAASGTPATVIFQIAPGAISVDAGAKDGEEVADDVLVALQRRAKLIFGDSTKWSQVQE